ncbi:hypothetical protein, partial [Escherichia coli]|uniref:hypothetical protein n=1 Tax=Escherichia coli TaxID=562 RepID=UPI001BC82D7F
IAEMHNRKLVGFLHVLLLSSIMNAYAKSGTETNDGDAQTKKETINVLTSTDGNNLQPQSQKSFQNSGNNT